MSKLVDKDIITNKKLVSGVNGLIHDINIGEAHDPLPDDIHFVAVDGKPIVGEGGSNIDFPKIDNTNLTDSGDLKTLNMGGTNFLTTNANPVLPVTTTINGIRTNNFASPLAQTNINVIEDATAGVTGERIKIRVLRADEYRKLAQKDANTLYFIKD